MKTKIEDLIKKLETPDPEYYYIVSPKLYGILPVHFRLENIREDRNVPDDTVYKVKYDFIKNIGVNYDSKRN
jgi:hypothetical protein